MIHLIIAMIAFYYALQTRGLQGIAFLGLFIFNSCVAIVSVLPTQ